MGAWTWVEQEEGGGEPALQHHGVEFWAGSDITPEGLAKAARDLLKLASAIAVRAPTD